MAIKKMYADTKADIYQIFLNRNRKYIENDEWEEVFDNWDDLSHPDNNNVSTFIDCDGNTIKLEINNEALDDGFFLDSFTDFLLDNDMLDSVLGSFKKIPSGLFRMSQKVKEVHIPASVQIIGKGAFANLLHPLDVYIPITVGKIEAEAFGATVDFYNYVGGAKCTIHYEGDEESFTQMVEQDWNSNRPNIVIVKYNEK